MALYGEFVPFDGWKKGDLVGYATIAHHKSWIISVKVGDAVEWQDREVHFGAIFRRTEKSQWRVVLLEQQGEQWVIHTAYPNQTWPVVQHGKGCLCRRCLLPRDVFSTAPLLCRFALCEKAIRCETGQGFSTDT